ncbi:MAG TPA: helix-turn-helix domain-containing protein [Acidimicrobiia bacterium]|nr:helix-turn-helix domain-containing protein [Acidimicrobiia bacterium]
MAAAARREQVLDAALRIIARDGYGAVSIDGIARELDVTRPVVYSHFDGLEALLLSLLDRQAERAVQSLLSALSIEPDLRDPRRYVHATVVRLCSIVAADPVLWAPIFAPAAATPEVVRDRIRRDREAVRTRIQTLLEALAQNGGLPAGVDSRILSHAVVAIGEHFGRILIEDPTALNPDAVAATLSAMLVPVRRRGPGRRPNLPRPG